MPEVSCHIDWRRAVLSVAGEVDVASVSGLITTGEGLLAEPGVEEVIVDLAGVEFIDSSAPGALVALRSRSVTLDKAL